MHSQGSGHVEPLYERLSAIETFRIPSFNVRFDAANSKQGPKCIFAEPLLASLRAERRKDMASFCFAKCFIQAYEEIGRSEIAVVLGNFVFENQVIAERIPCEFGYQTMVLM